MFGEFASLGRSYADLMQREKTRGVGDTSTVSPTPHVFQIKKNTCQFFIFFLRTMLFFLYPAHCVLRTVHFFL
jgi:hypothetical protein